MRMPPRDALGDESKSSSARQDRRGHEVRQAAASGAGLGSGTAAFVRPPARSCGRARRVRRDAHAARGEPAQRGLHSHLDRCVQDVRAQFNPMAGLLGAVTEHAQPRDDLVRSQGSRRGCNLRLLSCLALRLRFCRCWRRAASARAASARSEASRLSRRCRRTASWSVSLRVPLKPAPSNWVH